MACGRRLHGGQPEQAGQQRDQPETAPGYVKADALVEYRVNADTSVKLNIDNLTGKVYYNTLYRGFAAPGEERSARLTLTSRF